MRTYKNEEGKQVLDFEGETLWFDEPLESLSELMAENTVFENAVCKLTKERENLEASVDSNIE